MESVMEVYGIVQLILLVLTALATAYFLFFALSGLFYRDKKLKPAAVYRKFAVLIPAYKEDRVILEAAANALEQDYPKDRFDVVVIADSFNSETLQILATMPLKTIEVRFEQSTKTKALNLAMSLLPEDYDIALVLDADNLMQADFLQKINRAFEDKILAVQGHRMAKNSNTRLAVLDAVSEEINNHLFRRGHCAVGLSAGLIGSGMAFDYAFFKKMMLEVKAIGGFDKEIELRMLREGSKIEYLEDACVLDEKVQNSAAFSVQRRRWLSAQFYYFGLAAGPALRELFTKGNLDFFFKALQFIQPPRVLLLGLVLVESVLFLLLNSHLALPAAFNIAWLSVLGSCLLAFVFAVPGKFYNKQTAGALLYLPKGMFLMLMSLLKIKGANKTFLHTPHGASDTAKK
ncbi:MAG: glycosyltransferase family 2 protein [Bacteroidales bacterium]|nr:glycosyltransferase family 2 protein [Bacteroidales bacterium]MDD3431330.1 glycosyltransferase family 2 protein [Bacteroidales bacterium]MDD4361650.1 glycosyltransferase family 2 protein [Bacteroidales bacterium]MDD4430277.1 glycosyltransferase family 2 protein [Bacteroidales bacterium]